MCKNVTGVYSFSANGSIGVYKNVTGHLFHSEHYSAGVGMTSDTRASGLWLLGRGLRGFATIDENGSVAMFVLVG